MKTKFEDIANLYYLCPIRVYQQSGPTIDTKLFPTYLGDLTGVKPILRPLSDITKDELSILWSIVFTREFNGVIHKHKANDTGRGKYAAERYVMSSGVERLGVEFDGNIWADSDLSVWRHNKHKITAYLLSKHFDLFGLIESGEAIDKTNF